MNALKLNTEIKLFNENLLSNKEIYNETNISLSRKSIINDFEILSLVNEINNTLKKDLTLKEITEQVFQKIQRLLSYKSYFIDIFYKGSLVFEFMKDCEISFKEMLRDYGVIKIAIEEKRSLFINNPIKQNNDEEESILIIPVTTDNFSNIIFGIVVEGKRDEYFQQYFVLFELIFNALANSLLTKIIDKENGMLRSILKEKDFVIKEELNYSTVGKICLRSFHSLKNRTQVIVSSFNLLQKLIIDSTDQKLEKIFSILNKEIPDFTKSIKMISEISKNLISEKSPMYFEIDRFIFEIKEFIDVSGIANNFEIIIEHLSKSKIYGNYDKLFQAFLLLIMELYEEGCSKIFVSTIEDALRINLSLNIQVSDKSLNNLLKENSNINFVQIKGLFKQNNCTLITKNAQDKIEILISIPKRSSQFKSKEIKNASDFSC
ncbi:MAG: hypothetical protein N3F03_01585 [Ignavibacteria bacterium]|nr:hypothetical protein [Ignavibacteria bacterium]